eukprot:gene10810-14511_t
MFSKIIIFNSFVLKLVSPLFYSTSTSIHRPLSFISRITSTSLHSFGSIGPKSPKLETGVYQTIPESLLLEGVQSSPAISNDIHILSSLNNRYIGLRHGESEANMMGVISSSPKIGTINHGLTITGTEQAKNSGKMLFELFKSMLFSSNETTLQPNNIIFYSSDFLRAKQTAEVSFESFYKQVLELQTIMSQDSVNNSSMYNILDMVDINIRITTALRERSFGEYDGENLLYYNRVWPIDTIDANNNRNGVESINQVISRMRTFISELERSYHNKTIVLVSHADTLQITQTYLCSPTVDPRLFHQFRFKNGEVRDMNCLPPPSAITYK